MFVDYLPKGCCFNNSYVGITPENFRGGKFQIEILLLFSPKVLTIPAKEMTLVMNQSTSGEFNHQMYYSSLPSVTIISTSVTIIIIINFMWYSAKPPCILVFLSLSVFRVVTSKSCSNLLVCLMSNFYKVTHFKVAIKV